MKKITLVCIFQLAALSLFAKTINIVDLGAVGDGVFDNTEIIQKAIDQCSAEGGKVVIPSGTYLSKPLFLKSNIHIEIESDATLLASVDTIDYAGIPGFINGIEVENITISGGGTFNGRGEHPNFAHIAYRPELFYWRDSKNITELNIKLLNSISWVQSIVYCEGFTLRGVYVKSLPVAANDGLDIDARDVIISGCYFDSDDDALCLKSSRAIPVENVTVTNCIFRTNCNAIKFGTGSGGGFKNINISNCVIYKASEDNVRFWQKAYPWEGITEEISVISGIALESVDGGIIEGVTISNIIMRDVQVPIFIRLANRVDREDRVVQDRTGEIRDISLSHIIAYGCSKVACSITGIPGHNIENVTVSDVQMTVPGGATEGEMQQKVLEKIYSYPESRVFDVVLPASGFYVRHAQNIAFDQVHIRTLNPDVRPAYFLTDAANVTITKSTLNNQPATIKRVE